MKKLLMILLLVLLAASNVHAEDANILIDILNYEGTFIFMDYLNMRQAMTSDRSIFGHPSHKKIYAIGGSLIAVHAVLNWCVIPTDCKTIWNAVILGVSASTLGYSAYAGGKFSF
jgi:hypothetical protein